MKIRSITLDNVRRFTDPVTVGPIADGITLLCQPNESGKSTLFDALHAFFFVKYSAWRAEIAALQPHSGGKIAVALTLEVDGQEWRVRKQWQRGSGGEIRAWQGGTLRHQGDDAEHWLTDLVRGDGSGPSGLLWVRQGRVTLSVDGKYGGQDAKGEEHEQRRNLLTMITGAMDDLTGGKTMDGALDSCLGELAQLQTSTGRPKAGGAWAEAQALVDDLQAREARLAAQADELHDALTERRRLGTQLRDLEDPDTRARDTQDLNTAEAALKDAERHASQVAQAATEAALARQTHSAALAEAKAAEQRRKERRDAQGLAAQTETAAKAALDKLTEATTAWETASAALRAAEQDEKTARDHVQRVARRDAAQAAVAQRQKMSEVLTKAEAAETRAAKALAEAGRGPEQAVVDRIEALQRKLETARAVREAAGPKLTVQYHDGAPLLALDGTPMPDGMVHAVTGRSRIDIPGIGTLTISPAQDGAADPVKQAEMALSQALDAAGWPDLDKMRQAALARADALRMAQLAQQELRTLAPEGLQALRNDLARLPVIDDGDDTPLPDAETTEAAAHAAAQALSLAREVETESRSRRDAAKDLSTETRAHASAAAARLDRARQAAGDLPDQHDDTERQRIEALRLSAEEAEARHRALADGAPNLSAATARLNRIRAVIQQRADAIQTARLRLAELRAIIDTRAEEGVEEALQDTRLRLEAARERLDRVSFEVEVLRRLAAALQGAQTAARDRYYAPIAAELRPLLEELWDDAELVWSDDTLLPSGMIRKGETEPIDTLSGGTQEQIALLVRLAFARLLAKAGRHAPLILDDALVYSDDDRIEHLFNALHGAAQDLQIIVLSCRQRAFRALGAPQVDFLPAQIETP
ncbi:AAA family ATPase [Tropicibacter oceani]|uniref:AAA family ATPase n=1 Tax=Tropicibacter oceani TaxID=3058420 RepID=A0ABY8QKZ6_9RHOB|nr:AAA family ATPase [Tropicibacter oceani]WGW04696.1 AAA family ATPase [Tropicibacter oceani]